MIILARLSPRALKILGVAEIAISVLMTLIFLEMQLPAWMALIPLAYGGVGVNRVFRGTAAR